MNNYTSIIKRILLHEGGYCNVKGDTGGETYRGISRVHNPTWNGWKIIDNQKLVHNQILPELENEVYQFYYKKYWLANGLHLIKDYSLQYIIFDWVINSGVFAIKKVQEYVSAKSDGKLGLITAKLINEYNPEHLFNIIKHGRINFYYDIAKKGSNAKFLKGWLKRIESINYE